MTEKLSANEYMRAHQAFAAAALAGFFSDPELPVTHDQVAEACHNVADAMMEPWKSRYELFSQPSDILAALRDLSAKAMELVSNPAVPIDLIQPVIDAMEVADAAIAKAEGGNATNASPSPIANQHSAPA